MTSTQHPDLPRIPGYDVEAALGSGGMATVYRARQLALDRPVAVKVVRAYGREMNELNQRFEQEAKLIAALDHPNIVAIYEVTRTEDGDACYVMPLFTHGDLDSRPKPMPPAEIKKVLGPVLAALGHAHAKGVVHRDVKPANVLFDARGTPQLADFGVALRVQSNERLTAHGRAVGSSQSMSPEQARGEVVDGRSDLYSVGCLAYELLTGYPPYEGDDFLIVALKHQRDPIPRLPERLSAWQAFINRALAKEPGDRYADAAAMAEALERIDTAGAPGRVNAGPRPRRGAVLALVALALLAIVGLGARWLTSSDTPTTVAAADPMAAIAAASKRQHWFDGSSDSADALLLPQFAQEPVDAKAIDQRDSLLDAASAAMIAATDAELSKRLPIWRDFVEGTQARELPPVRKVVAALEARWRPALERARARRDRAEALVELPLAQALPGPSTEFAELTAMVAPFPARGEPFRDGAGPELLLIPGGRLAGYAAPFAVTRFEITRADYLRFAQASGRRPATCRDGGSARDWRDPGFPQTGADPVVCVSHADAVAYADWLSKQSGRQYRLPSVAEWRALSAAARVDTCANLKGENAACQDSYRYTAPAGHFASAPEMPSDFVGNVREWTADCDYKKVNVVKRVGTTIGNWFRENDKDASGQVCVGRFVAGSGWRDSDLDRAADVQSEDSAAVDRGFRLIREIR